MSTPSAVQDAAQRPNATNASAATPSIRIVDAHKHYRRADGTTVPAIDGIDLTVDAGDFVVLLGPSGCGKTTLLRSLAGLEDLDSGTIEVEGRTLFDRANRINLPPENRRVGMMFQSYALWPHMTVEKNVAYPLVSQKLGRREIAKRVADILAVVGITDLAGQYPTQISGGQQQRVALARALVSGHGVVLFDEPLSNVDARVRDHLRTELQRLHRELGFTAVYVTHDQDEALALATTVTVLEKGRVAQSAAPREVYETPASPYVARFMGSANELAGTVTAVTATEPGTPARVRIATALGEIVGESPDVVGVGDAVTAFIRPEKLMVASAAPSAPATNSWPATLDSEFFHGFYSEHVFAVGGELLRTRGLAETGILNRPSEIWLGVDPIDVRVLA